MAGLMKPDSGKIEVAGNSWFDSDKGYHLKPGKRGLGFVFQDYALFPNMTVLENLEFARGADNRDADLHELLEVMELGELRNSKPGLLSGGQQQRVALARALASKPRMLLLDEPFTALHGEIRARLSEYLLKIQRESAFTLLLITHDIGDIFRLTNRVLVLERGKISKTGTPEVVFLGDRVKSQLGLTGTILRIVPAEELQRVTLKLQSEMVEVLIKRDASRQISVGDQVCFSVDLQNAGEIQISPYARHSHKNG
jgi:molybdate transport system ATP-binding protein